MDPSAISDVVDFIKAIDYTKVKGKVALVTGGASGIGAGIVRALCENGAEVMIADANLDGGEEYATKLADEGYEYVGSKTAMPSSLANQQAETKSTSCT